MAGIADVLWGTAIDAVEKGIIPDSVTRLGIRLRLKGLLERLEGEYRDRSPTDAFLERIASSPIAVAADAANRQHYEVPTAYFDIALGPRKKYSSCLWEYATTLEEAEEEMLQESVKRADIRDGMRILDLGCGWGSFSLYAAERFPNSRITAFSNSRTQKEYIDRTAREKGFTNLTVVTGNAAETLPRGPFDRVVSVEMLEHVRNHRELFARLKKELAADAKLFIHVFTHHTYPFTYDDTGSKADWMAREFFSGGIMPSEKLLPQAASGIFSLERGWYVNGTHYAKTLRAWLMRHDAHASEIEAIFRGAGAKNPRIAAMRWRLFYMASEELFAYENGREWGVSHYLFSA